MCRPSRPSWCCGIIWSRASAGEASSPASSRSPPPALLFIAAQFYGTMAVPEADFVRYLRGRMADPSRTDLLSFSLHLVPAAVEGNRRYLGAAAAQHPWHSRVRAADLAAHAAVAIFCEPDRSACRSTRIAGSSSRRSSSSVSAYLVMFAMVFDYSRWISNWAVCMFLILHAVKTLPASRDVAPISGDDRKTTIFGWIVTLIPRVGIVRPFLKTTKTTPCTVASPCSI